jgi:hypothetical protein
LAHTCSRFKRSKGVKRNGIHMVEVTLPVQNRRSYLEQCLLQRVERPFSPFSGVTGRVQGQCLLQRVERPFSVSTEFTVPTGKGRPPERNVQCQPVRGGRLRGMLLITRMTALQTSRRGTNGIIGCKFLPNVHIPVLKGGKRRETRCIRVKISVQNAHRTGPSPPPFELLGGVGC